MAERAYWEQENRHGQVDRIELHDVEYGGASPELQFKGDKTGFTRQWDEITSESNDKLINVQANRIQIGKYDFRPRIEDATGFQILEDIRDSDNKRFHIVHKIDGTFEWAGWVTTRIFSYPEKGNNFFAHIRATDFEILKGQDYPLDDTRQTFIDTFADLFSELPTNVPIKTATSWVEENVTTRVGNETYDFLDEIYHETKALRDFARTGDETDQPITKWEALEHVAEPGLLIRQMGGHVMIDQLTDLADPTDVNETIYDSTGTVTTATASVYRRQTGYTTTDNGTPSIKVSSQNDTYPAIKRATVKFDHRSTVSAPKLPNAIYLTGNEDRVVPNEFIAGNDQRIEISAYVFTEYDEDHSSGEADVKIRVGQYYFNGVSWTTNSADNVTVSLTGSGQQVETPIGEPNYYRYNGFLNIITPEIPPDAQSPVEITFFNALINASPDEVATNTIYDNISFRITNLENSTENTTSVDYELTQENRDFTQTIDLGESWFGDGPSISAVSALRYSPNTNADITSNSWRRRGQTIPYRRFHENQLKELMDLSRSNVRKFEADIWGAYDPTKVLDYNGSYFYFAGGKYDGTRGRWRVTLMELDLQTGSDTFDDIPKFTDETGSGTGTTSTGGGGGIDTDTGDARYFKQANNLSEGDPATIRSNIDVYSTTESDNLFLTENEANGLYLEEANNLSDLESASSAISNLGITATASELNRLDGALATVQSNLGLTDGSASLDLADLTIDSLTFNDDTISSSGNIVLDAVGDVLINGDTIRVDKEMTTTDNVIVLNDGETGAGITAGEAGLQFDRGAETNYEILFQESNGLFSIGEVGSLQAVATRPDSPDNNGIAIWDDTNNWYETDSALTFDGSTLSAPAGNFSDLLTAQGGALIDDGGATPLEIGRAGNNSSGRGIAFLDGTGTSVAQIFGQPDGRLLFRTSGNDNIFDSNGNVGIGTTNPTEALDVDGNILASGTLDVGDDTHLKGALTVDLDSTFKDDIQYNSLIESQNFADAAGIFTGFQLGQNEFKAETIRANELRVKAFVAEVSAALYGEDILTKSRGVLSRNFTVPAVGNTETLYVEDLEGFEDTPVFDNDTQTDDDWIRLRVVDRSGGGLNAFNVWGRVTSDSYSNLSGGEQSWTFTRVSGGSATTGDTVYEGSIAIDYGTSGDSVIVRSVIGDNTPRDTQLTWTTDPINANNYSIVTRTGILDDIDYASGSGFYGENQYLTGSLLAGDLSKGSDGSGNYIEYDGSNINVFANNAQIGDTEGWFGASDILSYSSNSVGIAGFDADSNSIDGTQTDHRITMGDNAGIGGYGFGVKNTTNSKSLGIQYRDGRAEMYAYNGSSDEIWIGDDPRGLVDWGMRIRANDNDIVQISNTQAQFFGSYTDAGAQWAGAATKTNTATTFINDWANQTLQLGADASSITATSNAGIYLDGTGVFNFAIDSSNYIRNQGSQLRIETDYLKINTTNFALDTVAETMSLGSVFSADGGADTGQLSSLEVFPSHIQSADNAFRLGGQGLQMDTGASASSTQAVKWYDGGYNLSDLQHAIVPANTGLEVFKRDADSGNLNVIAQFQDEYLNLPDGLRIQDGLLVTLNLPTSDPQRQGQVWHDETNNVLRLSTPNDPVISVNENGTDEIVISLDNATTGPYDIKDASDDSVIANDVSMPYTDTGLNPDTEYCYYVTDNNGNNSNTDCATTLALSPEISCSGGTSAIQVNLDTPSTSPYTMYRNGSVYETGLVDADFPYTDNFITGTYQYHLEDANGQFSNTTECTAT